MKKILWISAGCLALSLAVLGLFLPLLPTTPFLLLAAACFFRGSERLYNRLISHPVFGPTILAYRKYRAVSLRTKTASLALLWLTIAISAILLMKSLFLVIILLAAAVGVSIHILHFRVLTSEMRAEMNGNAFQDRKSTKEIVNS